MQTDYKISQLTVNDDGTIVLVARTYEGETASEQELIQETMEIGPVVRYRRSAALRTQTIDFPAGADVHAAMRARLSLDLTRDAIPEQALQPGDLLAPRGTVR